MAADSLRTLARHLDVPERTLRRAAEEGLVRGERISERRFKTTLREEAYLRTHWPLLRRLREALRTERNVRAAVLFGSVATGHDEASSDVDLVVWLRDPGARAVAELADRLTDRIGREVQLVREQEAERSPGLMADALAHGRVLVDRDRIWPAIQANARAGQQPSARERTLEDSLPDLGLS